MNGEQSIFDLIEKYHQGLLSEEDKALVEKRMQTDASFAEYVRVNGLTNELVHSAGLDMLRERMSSDLAMLDQKRTRMKWGIGTGIVAAVLVSASTIYFTQNPEEKISPLSDIHQQQISTSSAENKTAIVPETTDKSNNISTPGLSQREEKPKADTTNNITSVNALTGKVDTADKVKTSPYETYKNPVQVNPKEENQKESNLAFDIIVQATCKGDMNGTIAVDEQSMSGGTKPYRFHISNYNKESVSGVFSDLDKGNYTITMYDSKERSYSKSVTVPEKNCTSKKSYSFNPDYGEICKIPSPEGESGSFTIYNRAGITIFKGNFTGQGSLEWTGINSMGITVGVGLYMCIVEYSDGKTEAIEISVIR